MLPRRAGGIPQFHQRRSAEAVSRDERHLNWLRSLGIKSAIAVPLTVRGKTIGALQVISVNPAHRYNCDDLSFVEEIARRAALAIDNAHLFKKITETSQASRFLADTALTLSGSLEHEEVLRLITRMSVPFVADFALGYASNERGIPKHVASAHRDPAIESLLDETARLHQPDPENLRSPLSRALSTGQPVLIEEVSKELLDQMGFEPRVRELFDTLAPVSWMTVPLVARDRTLGALVFGTVQPVRRYSADDLSLGQLLANRAALAIQNAQLYQSLQNALTTRDEVLAIVSHDPAQSAAHDRHEHAVAYRYSARGTRTPSPPRNHWPRQGSHGPADPGPARCDSRRGRQGPRH